MISPDQLALIVPLLCAHLIGDFIFQSDGDVRAKRAGEWGAFLRHGLIHGILAFALIGDLGAWYAVLVLVIVHAAIDAAKESATRAAERAVADKPGDAAPGSHGPFWLYMVDQALHLLTIAAIAWFSADALGPHPLWIELHPLMLLVAGAIGATRAGSVAIGLFVRPFLLEIEREREKAQGNEFDQEIAKHEIRRRRPRGLTEGGRTIGVLERALLFVFMLTGIESGVGFLIAAKSVFRFGELTDAENRMEAEYIIIGTFVSFAWGVGAGWATRWLLGQIPG